MAVALVEVRRPVVHPQEACHPREEEKRPSRARPPERWDSSSTRFQRRVGTRTVPAQVDAVLRGEVRGVLGVLPPQAVAVHVVPLHREGLVGQAHAQVHPVPLPGGQGGPPERSHGSVSYSLRVDRGWAGSGGPGDRRTPSPGDRRSGPSSRSPLPSFPPSPRRGAAVARPYSRLAPAGPRGGRSPRPCGAGLVPTVGLRARRRQPSSPW